MNEEITLADLTTTEMPTWCPACGDFNILFCVKNALAELNIPQHQVALVSGIGCGSKLPHFVKTYGFEGLHGRSLPVATGIKLANTDLTVMAVVGDGDCYGIGGNHLLHIMRRNFNLTLLVEDNAVYGLTKGQMSPTSTKGFKSPSTPSGSIEIPLNPMAFGILGGATYVARGYAYDAKQLQKLIADGIRHKGFAMIDILQPCSTYNKINTIQWYKDRVYKLEDENHDPTNREAAMKKAEEWGDRIPVGLIYKADRPTYEDGLPQIAEKALVKQDISNIDLSKGLEKFK